MRTFVLAVAATLALSAAASAHPLRTAYPPSTQPMVSGSVVSSTDHSVVLHTDEGETMTFIMDSHSVVPEHMDPGMRVSIEFRAMENGAFLAQRVIPLRPEQNRNTQTTVNGSELDTQRYAMIHGTEEGAALASTSTSQGTEAVVASNEGTETSNGEALPQTASAMPLVGLLGASALIAGSALFVLRRRRA